jgi:hypothetical protein
MKANKKRIALRASLVATTLLMTTAPAIAGGANAGNGGDGVVCVQPDGTKTVELLDFYEARTQLQGNSPSGMLAPQVPSGLSVEQIVKLFIGRLAKVSPNRAQEYQKKADAFLKDIPEANPLKPITATFIPNAKLEDIPDSEHIVIPDNCKIEQVAIQKDLPLRKREFLYTIDKDYWDLMVDGNVSKAGLILHEVIYGEAIALGQPNSIPTRYLTALIAADALRDMSDRQIYELFKNDLGFAYFEAHGAPFRAKVIPGMSDVELEHLQSEFPHTDWGAANSSFYPNGSIERGMLRVAHSFPMQLEEEGIRGQAVLEAGRIVVYDKSGNLSWRRTMLANGGVLVTDDGLNRCPSLPINDSPLRRSMARNRVFFSNLRPKLFVRLKDGSSRALHIFRTLGVGDTTKLYGCENAACSKVVTVELVVDTHAGFLGNKVKVRGSYMDSEPVEIGSKWAVDLAAQQD